MNNNSYRIVLKGTTIDDYDEYYKIRCSPADIYWQGFVEKPDIKTFKELFINRLSTCPFINPEDRRIYLIQIPNKDKKQNIGFVQLIKREDGVEIGYTVIEQYQNNGYATEALELGIQIAKRESSNIFLNIREDNVASQKVAKKCNFIPTSEIQICKKPIGIIKLRKYVLNN